MLRRILASFEAYKLKVFVVPPGENWVCDRLSNEWVAAHKDSITLNPEEADVIWLLASWCWKRIPYHLLKEKKVVTTVHHIVPQKFDDSKRNDFLRRDVVTDIYHVPSEKTRQQVVNLTDKPVKSIPWWVNQSIWFRIDKAFVRRKYGIGVEEFVVGSFQRDTEGSDLKSPKMEKGPDRFCDFVEKLSLQRENVSVLLAGWRRQYVINRLKSAGIKFRYAELPSFNMLNELYNCLDLYAVLSRFEGGPQSIVECAASKTPIISTDVGIAREILHDDSIIGKEELSATPNIAHAYEKARMLMMPHGFLEFEKMFELL